MPRGAHRLSPGLRWLGGLRHRTVDIVIRVCRFMVKIAALWARNLEAG